LYYNKCEPSASATLLSKLAEAEAAVSVNARSG
jgi:hypothetical protein